MSHLPDEITIDGDVYDTVPDEARIAVTYLMKVRDRVGITDETALSGTIKNSAATNMVLIKYATEVYKVWAALFPEEHKEFINDTEWELKYERPVKDAIKAGGYSPISFPVRLDRLYSILMPSVKTQDKRFWTPLLKQIPELKRTNYFK